MYCQSTWLLQLSNGGHVTVSDSALLDWRPDQPSHSSLLRDVTAHDTLV